MTHVNYYYALINYYYDSVSKLLWSPSRLITQNLTGLPWLAGGPAERDFLMDNLLVRIHFIIVIIRWIGLAPWEFEFPFRGSLASTFLGRPVPGPVLVDARIALYQQPREAGFAAGFVF